MNPNDIAARLRLRRRQAPKGPDDGLSPLNRKLKGLYPELFDDPAYSGFHLNRHHDPNEKPA